MTEQSQELLAKIVAKRVHEQEVKAECLSDLVALKATPSAKSIVALEQRVKALEAIVDKLVNT